MAGLAPELLVSLATGFMSWTVLLIMFYLLFHDTEPADRPEILRAFAEFIRALVEAIRAIFGGGPPDKPA